jgi:hypothetical protein
MICDVESVPGTSVPVTHYRLRDAKTWWGKVLGQAPFHRSIALLVGVSEYNNSWPPLPGVRKDLAEIRDYLLLQETFDDVYVLQDQDVTHSALNNLFYGHFNRKEYVGEEDRFLFFYAGHGSNKNGVSQMAFSKAGGNPI